MSENTVTSEIHPIFAECVSTENTRYLITQIFVKNGYRYAIDGRILVSQPVNEKDTEGNFPDCGSVMVGDFQSSATPIPQSDHPDTIECENCDGGMCWCYGCESEHDFGKCEGSGMVMNVVPLYIADGYRLAAMFLQRLREHGAKLYLPKPIASTKPAMFTIGDDIVGRLMPIANRKAVEFKAVP